MVERAGVFNQYHPTVQQFAPTEFDHYLIQLFKFITIWFQYFITFWFQYLVPVFHNYLVPVFGSITWQLTNLSLWLYYLVPPVGKIPNIDLQNRKHKRGF